MKVYEIGFYSPDDPDEYIEGVIWIATNRKISLAPTADGKYIEEIGVTSEHPGIDIIIE